MKISNINNLLSKDAEAKAFFMSLPEDAQGVLIGRGSTITSTAEMAQCLNNYCKNTGEQKQRRLFYRPTPILPWQNAKTQLFTEVTKKPPVCSRRLFACTK